MTIPAHSALLVAALALAACAAPPTPPPTPTSSPTPPPTATPLPLSAVDLEALLLQPGDLPADYQPGQIRRTWPAGTGEPPPAGQVRQVSLRVGDFVGDGLTLALYASAAEAEATYQHLANRLEAGEAQANLGVVATVAEARNNVFGVTSVQVVWVLEWRRGGLPGPAGH